MNSVDAPAVASMTQSVVALQGSTTILLVTVSGASPDVPNNAANRTWSGPSGTITTNSKYSFSTNRYSLFIKSVAFTDSGNYKFTASNLVGSASITITLTVEGMLKVVTINYSILLIIMYFKYCLFVLSIMVFTLFVFICVVYTLYCGMCAVADPDMGTHTPFRPGSHKLPCLRSE